MHEDDIAKKVVNEAIAVHRYYGPGIFERVYEAALQTRLQSLGLKVERQKTIMITDDYVVDEPAYIADLVINEKVIIEVKSVEKVEPRHKKQLLTYLRLADCRLGLLLNFNAHLLKHGIWRIVNNLEEKP